MSNNINRKLYGYWRSSASYRVRIALNLKGLDYEHHGVNLVKGEQHNEAFTNINPQGLIPLYVETAADGKPFALAQSLAIMDYIEQRYPDTPILPADARQRGLIHSLAQIIACDIHPLDNLRVLQYLESTLNVEADARMTWYRHWISTGFTALEAQLDGVLGDQTFSLGDKPGYLEAVIVPQLYNANRFNCPLDDYPRLAQLGEACQALPAFIQALPENQADAT